jgi:predicted metal-dependent hydrolase
LPRRAALAPALAWAERQRGWIEAGLARLPAALPIVDGATIPFEGGDLAIRWDPAGARALRRSGDRLLVGGPADSLRTRVLRWLKAQALATLGEETRVLAGRAGVTVARVAVADPRTRWGSCAVDGTIRYSWRLILAPPWVRRATVAHEVAHRIHMNHGHAFHAAVAELLGADPAPARAWLRAHGAALHWVGQEA